MSRVRSADLIALARANAERAAEVHRRLPVALSNALDWLPSGVSNGTGPKTSGGDHGVGLDQKLNPDGKGELRGRSDPHAALIRAAAAGLASIDRLTTDLEATLRKLTALDPDEARRLAEEAGAVTWECSNPACREVFIYSPDCRPRGGQCKKCFDYWSDPRHLHEYRPHRLVHRTPAPACEDCRRVWASGEVPTSVRTASACA